MVHYSIYVEDELASKIEEQKQVRHNKNSSQVIREILYDFFGKNTDKSVNTRPTLTPEERAEPGIRLLEMPEIPRCVKTRAMWDAWIEGYRKDNLSWEVDGENKKWVIPDEPPKGMFEE